MDLHTIASGALLFVGAGLSALFPAQAAMIAAVISGLQVVVTRFARQAPPQVKP